MENLNEHQPAEQAPEVASPDKKVPFYKNKYFLIMLGGFLILGFLGRSLDRARNSSNDIAQETAKIVQQQVSKDYSTEKGFYTSEVNNFSAVFPEGADVVEAEDGTTYSNIDYPHKILFAVITPKNINDSESVDTSIKDMTTLEAQTDLRVASYEKDLGTNLDVITSQLTQIDNLPAYFVEAEARDLNRKMLVYDFLSKGRLHTINILYPSSEEEYAKPLVNNFIDSFQVTQ